MYWWATLLEDTNLSIPAQPYIVIKHSRNVCDPEALVRGFGLFEVVLLRYNFALGAFRTCSRTTGFCSNFSFLVVSTCFFGVVLVILFARCYRRIFVVRGFLFGLFFVIDFLGSGGFGGGLALFGCGGRCTANLAQVEGTAAKN